MHIPDGYLSPQTCAVLGAGMLPVWYTASRKVKEVVGPRSAPLLAAGAAFAFVIQMFNIPIPGGTTAHAVGGTLVAIVLGPWAAVIALTVTLALQALLFGDGGVLALGANAFNMAFVLPLVGYYSYRLISAGSEVGSPRRWLGAGVGAFLGLNAAALLTAIEFGLQPTLFRAADGTPLYAPYGLEQAVLAMMLAHLLVAGPVEGIITALAVAYLQKANRPLLELYPRALVGRPAAITPQHRWLWVGLLALVILSPLGLLASGTAWGEWAPEELTAMAGFAPEGLQALSGLWGGILSDYAVPGWQSGLLAALGYILSGAVGILAISLAAYGLGALLTIRGGDAA